MIRIDSIWLATEPMDMRAGTETALARVIAVFGAAKPHCAYLFANRRANRMKVLVHDGIGVWLAARRLNQGKFHWPSLRQGSEMQLIVQRDLVPEGSAISRALDYSLKRWAALSRYLDDGAVPIDNNWAENQTRPWALGRKNWLFAGSLRSGKRAAAIMSLIQSARLNGHDPYAYLKDVLTRLPTQQASEISELLPHRWTRA
ncbi:hypothetical protein PspS35_21530 [Pseudomonas sp. S35]|nr:hypothetical protein PspS35_21530 [Pseudomonas sp. S35]